MPGRHIKFLGYSMWFFILGFIVVLVVVYYVRNTSDREKKIKYILYAQSAYIIFIHSKDEYTEAGLRSMTSSELDKAYKYILRCIESIEEGSKKISNSPFG